MHRALPLAFVDYIIRCVRMQEQVELVLRLLSVEERATLGHMIDESYDEYVALVTTYGTRRPCSIRVIFKPRAQ